MESKWLVIVHVLCTRIMVVVFRQVGTVAFCSDRFKITVAGQQRPSVLSLEDPMEGQRSYEGLDCEWLVALW